MTKPKNNALDFEIDKLVGNNAIPLDVEIDKLTNSIENTVTGDKHSTEILSVNKGDLEKIKKDKTWNFDWGKEYKTARHEIYKLTISNNCEIIQGLMSVEEKFDHIYMHLIESASFNRGKKKMYLGVPGNLVAYACKISSERGFEGYVAFDAKTSLVQHYQETLFATHFKGSKMYIDTPAALRLITQYFSNHQ